jgi:hypothetical protein
MSYNPVLEAWRWGLNHIVVPVRRRITEYKVDAFQRRLGLWRQPGEQLLNLMKQAEDICSQVKNDAVLGEYFTADNPWSRRPWRGFNYWNGWYALAKQKKPLRVLEIGTAFGFSTISLARGAGEALKLLVSLDLGNYGRLLSSRESPEIDNLLYVKEGIDRYRQENGLNFEYLQFNVNTQPPPYTDDNGIPVECPYWKDDRELLALLGRESFDMILIDGKHVEDGLYNDLTSFYGHGTSGCLIVCDDIQHKDAAESLSQHVRERDDVADYAVWRFLHSSAEYAGTLRRDQGLIIKK